MSVEANIWYPQLFEYAEFSGVLTFPVLDQKCPFWPKLVQKIKIVSFRWNLIPKLIQICRIQCWCSLFVFRPEILFEEMRSKKGNCQLKLKFGTQNYLNMQNSMAVFTFSVLDQKYPFWPNLIQKVKIVLFRWNLIPRLIQICRIQC